MTAANTQVDVFTGRNVFVNTLTCGNVTCSRHVDNCEHVDLRKRHVVNMFMNMFTCSRCLEGTVNEHVRTRSEAPTGATAAPPLVGRP